MMLINVFIVYFSLGCFLLFCKIMELFKDKVHTFILVLLFFHLPVIFASVLVVAQV